MWGAANPLILDPNQLSLFKSYRKSLFVFFKYTLHLRQNCSKLDIGGWLNERKTRKTTTNCRLGNVQHKPRQKRSIRNNQRT